MHIPCTFFFPKALGGVEFQFCVYENDGNEMKTSLGIQAFLCFDVPC